MPHFIKNRLQSAAKTSKGNLSEVNLFREMMSVFRRYYNATVIFNETHQKLVDFDTHDPHTGTIIRHKTKEISDLHIITYSPSRCIVRETFLQAKVARGNNGLQGNGIFKFQGDWFQYDLLARRPLIFPPHKGSIFIGSYYHKLLRNAVLPSIGSYGVFYKNSNNLVDFAYQPANLLQLVRMPSKYMGEFNMVSANTPFGMPLGIPDLYYTTSVDFFETAIIHNLVGSPLTLSSRYNDIPYWWRWYDDLFYYLYRNKRNTRGQIEEVFFGIEKFREFIYKNREVFIQDGEEHSETLKRYYQLNDLVPHDKGNDDFNGIAGEQANRNIENDYSDICRGPISLVLIDTDKCIK